MVNIKFLSFQFLFIVIFYIRVNCSKVKDDSGIKYNLKY